jgi:hypothetical protein
MTRWRDRPTGDILVLAITFTICGGLIAVGVAGSIFAFVNPGANLDGPARFIADITNTLIGLLAGFLAGTTTNAAWKRDRSGQGEVGDGYEGKQEEGEQAP